MRVRCLVCGYYFPCECEPPSEDNKAIEAATLAIRDWLQFGFDPAVAKAVLKLLEGGA